VFFGGISVYLQQHAPVFRHAPALVDKLLDSSWLMKAATSGSIATNPRSLGELTISMLKGENGFQRKEFDKLLQWLVTEPPPDVIQLPNALLISLAKPLKRELKRPVHCTLQGEDLFLDGLDPVHRRRAIELIRENAPFVDRFTAVSGYYADYMSKYLSISRDKVDVVPLGMNLDGFEQRVESSTRPFTVGYLARIAPEKGLHSLCDAYVRFRQRPGVQRAQLEVAGYMAADQQGYLREAKRRLEDSGMGGEFQYRGLLSREEKITFLRNLDVFSVPTAYVEPKGLFLLEAMACGVPVIQPNHGAFPEMIAKTAGGVLVEPADADCLADGIYDLWKNPERRAELGRNGFAGVRRHYSVARSADRMLEVYQRSMC
jgi:glycosyltransferase involved in cell wall biosynthesis